jgi:hypothetical protein
MFVFGNVEAQRAEDHLFMQLAQCLGQGQRVFCRIAQQIKGQARGGFWSHARQSRKFIN